MARDTTAVSTLQAPLFVPATRTERYAKALTSGADGVIIDLEDAVAQSQKHQARTSVRDALPGLRSGHSEQDRDHAIPVGVRVNSVETDLMADDAALVRELAEHVDFVVLPQVRASEDIAALLEHFSDHAQMPVIALIECSQGLLNAQHIAAHPDVCRLALGSADLAQDWGIHPSASEEEFDVSRQMLVIASRAAGLQGPLDSPHMNVRDVEGLRFRMRASAQLGMKGKLCLHPQQVQPVRDALVVSAQDYERLSRVIEVFEAAESRGEAAVRLDDGSFIDYPIYRRALTQVTDYRRAHGV